MAMARLNVRIRSRLFSALLHQEVGFFDKTKTGEITSRLSADTTTVADQVCLCVMLHGRSERPSANHASRENAGTRTIRGAC